MDEVVIALELFAVDDHLTVAAGASVPLRTLRSSANLRIASWRSSSSLIH